MGPSSNRIFFLIYAKFPNCQVKPNIFLLHCCTKNPQSIFMDPEISQIDPWLLIVICFHLFIVSVVHFFLWKFVVNLITVPCPLPPFAAQRGEFVGFITVVHDLKTDFLVWILINVSIFPLWPDAEMPNSIQSNISREFHPVLSVLNSLHHDTLVFNYLKTIDFTALYVRGGKK